MSAPEVTFDDVAVSFSAEEWETLEKWQKELYKDVMVDHYQTLLSVGLMKVIPEIIQKIMMGEVPVVNHKSMARMSALEARVSALEARVSALEAPAHHRSSTRVTASEVHAHHKSTALVMSPGTPQGNTSPKQTLGNSQNNTKRTEMNLIPHNKLNLPPESYTLSTIQKVKVIHKKSEVQENVLENQGDSGVDMRPAIDNQAQRKKDFICVNCGKSFRGWSSLVSHTTVNTCISPHSCFGCEASFNSQSQLLIHQKLHSELKLFECPTCGKRFLRKSSLAVHNRTHTGERPFICKLCNKSFTELGKLRRHVRIHTGERPFRCDSCGKCFNDSSVLKRHQKVYCPSNKGKLKKPYPQILI